MADPDPLEEAQFLARSENRIQVLQHLATGPADRTELQDATGTSRVTLGRILGDFEEYDWVQRQGSEYRITALGAAVVEGFGGFLDAVEASQRLRRVDDHLPAKELELPVRHLNDAEITLPTESQPAKYLKSFIPAARGASRISGLWSVLDPDLLRRHRDWVVDGDTRVEFVFDQDVLETIRREPPGRLVAELARSPDADVYEYDGTFPVTILVVDGTVFMLLVGPSGYEGIIESDDGAIRAWAEDWIEHYRERSAPVDPSAFEER